MAFHIRRATIADSAAMLRIYEPYVRTTTVTFEFEPPSLEEFSARVAFALKHFTWLVIEDVDETLDAQTSSRVASSITTSTEDYCHSNVRDASNAGESGATILGYAYYGPLGERAAYQWSAETSIYLDMAQTGRGLGTHLLDALEACMAAQGIYTSEACITSENIGSQEFHQQHGYIECARFHNCASKFGRWLGTVWMEKQLAPYVEAPELIHPLDEVSLTYILTSANKQLQL